MESPIRSMRKQLAMSEDKFSLALGISQSGLSRIERGLVGLSPIMRRSLKSLHVDDEKLVRLHRAFMAETKKALRDEIRGKMGA